MANGIIIITIIVLLLLLLLLLLFLSLWLLLLLSLLSSIYYKFQFYTSKKLLSKLVSNVINTTPGIKRITKAERA